MKGLYSGEATVTAAEQPWGVGAGGGAGAIRLFYGTRNTVRCNNYDYVTGLC